MAMSAAEWFGETLRNNAPCLWYEIKSISEHKDNVNKDFSSKVFEMLENVSYQ